MQIIAKSRLKRVKDWRVKKIHWTSAFFSKTLRPNDMQFIYSLIGAFVTWLIGTIIMMATAESAAQGLVYSIPFVYVTVCVMIASAVIYQSRTFETKELVYWGVVQGLYLIIGVIYFIYAFEIKEMSLKNIGVEAEFS